MELGPEDVSLLERCPHFRGCSVQASIELGPEYVPLLERCPHFRGCLCTGFELGPEDVSLNSDGVTYVISFVNENGTKCIIYYKSIIFTVH